MLLLNEKALTDAAAGGKPEGGRRNVLRNAAAGADQGRVVRLGL